jgi:hypothetical protein
LEELSDYIFIVGEDYSLITMKLVPATFTAKSGTSHRSTQLHITETLVFCSSSVQISIVTTVTNIFMAEGSS